MGKILLEVISTDMKDKKVIWNSRYGFTKGKFCLTNLIAFYKEMTSCVGKGRAVLFILTLVTLLTWSTITSL